MTATIQIGSPHSNDGGLRSFAYIQLEEGNRPALTFRSLAPEVPRNPVVMIPTVDNTLEDALLLIAYVLNLDPEIAEALTRARIGHRRNRLEMYEVFDEPTRSQLYGLLMDKTKARDWPYLVGPEQPVDRHGKPVSGR